MGNSYGRTVVDQIGSSIQVTADGRPEMKAGGVTVDWTTVAALGADTTFLDGVDVAAGEKVLRYGQVLARITASGKWGPYDPAAVDGRAALAKGESYIVNETTREDALHSDHPPVLYGGLCFKNRIIATTGAASLAAGPTFTALDAALPRLAYVTET